MSRLLLFVLLVAMCANEAFTAGGLLKAGDLLGKRNRQPSKILHDWLEKNFDIGYHTRAILHESNKKLIAGESTMDKDLVSDLKSFVRLAEIDSGNRCNSESEKILMDNLDAAGIKHESKSESRQRLKMVVYDMLRVHSDTCENDYKRTLIDLMSKMTIDDTSLLNSIDDSFKKLYLGDKKEMTFDNQVKALKKLKSYSDSSRIRKLAKGVSNAIWNVEYLFPQLDTKLNEQTGKREVVSQESHKNAIDTVYRVCEEFVKLTENFYDIAVFDMTTRSDKVNYGGDDLLAGYRNLSLCKLILTEDRSNILDETIKLKEKKDTEIYTMRDFIGSM